MAVKFISSWDFAELGLTRVQVNQSGSSTVASWSSGKFSHVNLTSVSASKSYPDWSTDNTGSNGLADQLTSGLPFAFTVTFDTGSMKYSIESSYDFLVSGLTDDNGAKLLGLNPDDIPISATDVGGGTWRVQSSRMPYFAITGAMGARSDVSEDFEPEGRITVNEADDGSHHMVFPSALPIYQNYTIPFESKAMTFKRFAPDGNPFTWEGLFRDARGKPFLLIDDVEKTVQHFREGGAHFEPNRVEDDFDDYWNIEFEVYIDNPDRTEEF